MQQVWTGIIAIGVGALISIGVYLQQPKTAFVDNQRLFAAFEGKKELEARLEQGAQAQQAALDSLKLQLMQLERLASTDATARQQFLIVRQQYEQQQQQLDGAYQQQSRDYTEVIWKQISHYTIAYGKANGYDYIFGTAGQGSLMYGAQQHDITEEVLIYINQQYAGK